MEKLPEWVWVMVEKEGESETFYALEEESGRKIIPVFKSADDGMAAQRGFKKRTEARYEIEAIRLDVISATARKNDGDLVILDGQGRILERLTPA